MADPSPAPSSGVNANSVLLVVGSALVGALLLGGLKVELPSGTTPVVVVQGGGASPAGGDVTTSMAPAAAGADESSAPTPSPVPAPAPRIPTFDLASIGGAAVLGFGLVALVVVAGAAAVVGSQRRNVGDEEILFDGRSEGVGRAALIALSLVFVGLGALVLVPAIEVVFDADHLRYLETNAPSASPSGGPTPSPAVSPTPSQSASPTPMVSPTPAPLGSGGVPPVSSPPTAEPSST